ncbi:MAG: hypothetical protein PHF86_13920 [Candidatus Nanoarchaeia archaeon]|nr:hypothetical protein [Candidatus Nanoarchaeia archaeon]
MAKDEFDYTSIGEDETPDCFELMDRGSALNLKYLYDNRYKLQTNCRDGINPRSLKFVKKILSE